MVAECVKCALANIIGTHCYYEPSQLTQSIHESYGHLVPAKQDEQGKCFLEKMQTIQRTIQNLSSHSKRVLGNAPSFSLSGTHVLRGYIIIGGVVNPVADAHDKMVCVSPSPQQIQHTHDTYPIPL